MRESARTDLREPQGSNPLGPPGLKLRLVSPELRPPGVRRLWLGAVGVALPLVGPLVGATPRL